MLPRELIEELIGRYAATGHHVVMALADSLEGFLIVLTLPLEVVGQGVVEGVSRALPPPASELLQLCQSLRLEWNRVHFLKVEVRHADVNSSHKPMSSLKPIPRLHVFLRRILGAEARSCRACPLWRGTPEVRNQVKQSTKFAASDAADGAAIEAAGIAAIPVAHYISRMRFEKMWVEQSRAATAIRRRFDAKSAADDFRQLLSLR
jgi:hypothetical protein